MLLEMLESTEASFASYCLIPRNTGGPPGYDVLDFSCFEVMKAPHKNTKDKNIEVVKLDHWVQELQYFCTAILG